MVAWTKWMETVLLERPGMQHTTIIYRGLWAWIQHYLYFAALALTASYLGEMAAAVRGSQTQSGAISVSSCLLALDHAPATDCAGLLCIHLKRAMLLLSCHRAGVLQ